MQKFTTFFMFDGDAEEAMNFYVGLFKNSSILSLTQYGVEGPGTAGSVMQARFSLDGHEFMCIDSAVKHSFSFTPSMSVFVNYEDDEEIEKVFAAFADGGKVMMPLDTYGFSKKFGWVADKFGVSWQLNLD